MLAAAGITLAVAGAAAPVRAEEDPPDAQTVSVTIQAIWQVQEGCSRDCHGTSQTQLAVQSSTTVQVATAPAATGIASNRHVTIQIVVQSQLGCVELCYGTRQLQAAVQQIDINQLAAAVSGAANDATATQFVWQVQQGCHAECHDAQSSQVIEEAQEGAPLPPFPLELDAFRAWVATLAASLSATLDFIEQHDVAACLEHCAGEAQVQLGVQVDVTVQVDAATGTTTATAVADALEPTGRPARATVEVPRAAARKNKAKSRKRAERRGRACARADRRTRRSRSARCTVRRAVVRAPAKGGRFTPTRHSSGVWSALGRTATTRHWRDSSDR